MRGPVGRSVDLALFRCTTSAGRPPAAYHLARRPLNETDAGR